MANVQFPARVMAPERRVRVANACLGGHPVFGYEKPGREIIAVPHLFRVTVTEGQRGPVAVKELEPYTKPGDMRKIQISVSPEVARSTPELFKRVEKSITLLTIHPGCYNPEWLKAWTWGTRFDLLSSLAGKESFDPRGLSGSLSESIREEANQWLWFGGKNRLHTTIPGNRGSQRYTQFSSFYLTLPVDEEGSIHSQNAVASRSRSGNTYTTYPVPMDMKAVLKPLKIIEAIDVVARANCLNTFTREDDQGWDDFMRTSFLLHLVSMFRKDK
ncbi:MAG: hypothetical protein WC527_03730 [Candidatus Margulisiibacteriota bacterium]